jgi:zinc transport system substrate-binding protein
MRAVALLALTFATPIWAEVPKVVTDIPPVAALVAQVLGDLGQPGLLLDKGGDEHDLQLRPSQMRDLEAAGLVVWVGLDLTPGLADALAASGAPKLGLLDDPATLRLEYDDGTVNPHAWLDPDNAALWTGKIAEALAVLDAEHAATYRSNAAAAVARIMAMDGELAAKLAPIGARPFLAYHDAYGYFTQHYRLAYLGGLAKGDAAPPGAARLSAVASLADSGEIACVFPEAQHDPALLLTLGVPVGGPLDPVGSTLEPSAEAYDELMRAMADTLATCLAP